MLSPKFGLRYSVLAMLIATSSASALECPVTQTLGAGAAAVTSSTFAEKFSADQMYVQAPDIVAKLRGRFPDAGTARLTDFLMAAYCGKITSAKDASEVSEADKRDRLAAYAKWLGTILY